MIRVNLLPTLPRKKVAIKIELTQLPFVVLIVIAVCVAGFAQIKIQRDIKKAEREIKEAQEECLKLKPILEEVAKLKAEKEMVDKRIKIYADLEKKKWPWSKQLEEFSKVVPENVWITSMRLESREEKAPEKKKPAKVEGTGGKDEKAGAGEPAKKAPEKKEGRKKVYFLSLSCVTTSSKPEEMVNNVTNFMRRIMENSFLEDCFAGEPELLSISRSKIETAEVMNFQINCPFKEGKILD